MHHHLPAIVLEHKETTLISLLLYFIQIYFLFQLIFGLKNQFGILN